MVPPNGESNTREDGKEPAVVFLSRKVTVNNTVGSELKPYH